MNQQQGHYCDVDESAEPCVALPTAVGEMHIVMKCDEDAKNEDYGSDLGNVKEFFHFHLPINRYTDLFIVLKVYVEEIVLSFFFLESKF